jgi:hypothetical protein
MAKTTGQPAVKDDNPEGFPVWTVSEMTPEEIIKYGVAPGAGSKPPTKPA